MDTLPDELVLEIINHLFLDFSWQPKPVWNISLTNKRLHRLANELLYRYYSYRIKKPGLFIRALASSPNLERCVQGVDWGYNSSGAVQFPEALTAAEFRHISERVGFGKVEERKSKGRTRIQKLNAWLANRGREEDISTLLLFTRKIKELSIADTEAWDNKAVWFKPALDSRILSNLQEATLDGGLRIGNVLPLFLLPSMRTLRLFHVEIHRDVHGVGARYEWEANNAFWKRLEKEGSSLEHLDLPRVGADTLDLTRVLGSFQGLKKMEIAFQGHGLGRDEVNVRTLLRAIAHHRGSLTSLNIDDHRLEQDPDALGELSVLEHLESLEMQPSIFSENSLQRDFENLPKHLKHLHIPATEDYADLTEPLLDALLTMAPIINTILPNLERITLFDWHPQRGTFPCQRRIAALQSGFAKAGVELVSTHATGPGDASSDRWFEESRVTASTEVEEGWVWVHLREPEEGLMIDIMDDMW
jgi:hypothetical protein